MHRIPVADAVARPPSTEGAVLAALVMTQGMGVRRIWEDARREVGLCGSCEASPSEVLAVLGRLVAGGGPLRVAALSQQVRLSTALRSPHRQVCPTWGPAAALQDGDPDGLERAAFLQDQARLRALAHLPVTADGGELSAVASAVADVAGRVGTPIALATVVLDAAQVFAAAHGLTGTWLEEVGGTPAEWSFCARVVQTAAAFSVEDASRHPQLAGNPLVRHDGIRSYLGVPLQVRGHTVGALCAIDTEPRTFTSSDHRALQHAALTAGELLTDATEQRRSNTPV